MKYLFIFISCFSVHSVSAQNLKYARKVVDTLASPSMHGRGYVNDGDKVAANYLKKQFESFKLESFGKDYYQKFTLNVNAFQGAMQIESPDRKFIAGKDFIVEGSSGGIHGSLKVLWFNKNSFVSKRSTRKIKRINLSDKIMIVDKKGMNELEDDANLTYAFTNNWLKAKAIGIVEYGKLTADISVWHKDYPLIIFSNSAIDSTVKALNIEIQNELLTHYVTQNVISYIRGTQYPDSFLVFSAHYDHLGQMGKDVYFPGANDNASGCAMLLNLAQYYSQHPQKYSIAFMAFGAEEAGLVGSKYYIEHPLFPLKQIKFLVNFDLLGTGDEGITVVNGAVFKPEFDELLKLNEQKKYLPQIKSRGKAANSDHYWFSENGVKCFFIYTLGGIKAYHDIYDRPETLPLTKFEEVFWLLTDFANYLQK